MFLRIIFLVLIVCQDLVLTCTLCQLLFSVVREHRMQEYLKCRAYQINMAFRKQNVNENDSETSSSLLAFIQILNSSHCKFWRLAKFGNWLVGKVIL